jgi:hypothetical protein
MVTIWRTIVFLLLALLSDCTNIPTGNGTYLGSGFVVLCRGVGGCAPSPGNWHGPPGSTAEQFERDKAGCLVEADKAQMTAGTMRRSDREDMAYAIAANCLRAKGYVHTD